MLPSRNTPIIGAVCGTSLRLLHLTQNPLVVCALLLGTCVLAVGVVGWTWSGIRRRAAAAAATTAAAAAAEGDGAPTDQEGAGTGASLLGPPAHRGRNAHEAGGWSAAAAAAGGVTVVMPLRGCRPQAWPHWQALLGCHYTGLLEVLFVVDSAQDPAAAAVQQLMKHLGYTPLPDQQPTASHGLGRDQMTSAAPGGGEAAPNEGIAAAVREQLPAAKLVAQWAAPSKLAANGHPQQGQQQQWPQAGWQGSMGAATAHVAVQQPSRTQAHKLPSSACLPARPAAAAAAVAEADHLDLMPRRQQGQQHSQHQQDVPAHTQQLEQLGSHRQPAVAPSVCQPLPSGAGAGAAARCLVRLLVAGRAVSCSQKIHNQLAGLGAADAGRSRYVLFLDDDILLHPSSITYLVEGLECTSSSPGHVSKSSCGHTSSSPGFASNRGCEPATCSNGSCGCRSSSSSNGCGRCGGSSKRWSDAGGDLDGVCAAFCKQQRQTLRTSCRRPFMATGYPYDLPPPGGTNLLGYAVLAYHLPLLIGFSVAPTTPFVWGGCMMMRLADLLAPDSLVQVWRNGGYSDDLLAAGYCAARGYTIAVPPAALFPQVLQARYTAAQYWNYLRRQLFVLDTYQGPHDQRLNHALMLVHAVCSGGLAGSCIAAAAYIAGVVVWVLLGCGVVPCQISHGVGASGLLLVPTAAVRLVHVPWWQPAAWVFLVVLLAAHCSVWWMHTQVVRLWRRLSPCAPLSVLQPRVSWLRMWAGLVCESLLLPACMVYTYCCNQICWAGVNYQKSCGRVRVL